MLLRMLLLLVTVVVAWPAYGQSDQAIVSAIDSPDPVVPGATLTYTVTVANNGPNPAVNGGLNGNLDGNLGTPTFTAPAGFTCATFGSAFSCTNPSFAPGTVVITVAAPVAAHLLNFPDGTLTSSFSTSGVTPDPNSGNNSASAVTAFNSPQIDLTLSASDSPDPVGPDQNITYTVNVANPGPDAATNVNFNVFNNGTLRFQSATVPAGFSCTLPAVGGNPTFTCTAPTFGAGANAVFTVVVLADSALLGINDGTVQTVFGINGTGDDTNDGNNQEVETTAYVTPDADVTIAASDSPDPVFPDGDISYTITVGNNGPDTAPNVVLNVPLNNTLRFQSMTVPAGWNCTLPAVGAGTSFSCTNASLANGASSVFTLVLRANDEQFGINDQTIVQNFGANSGIADPNNPNNSINVSTQYVTPDADVTIAASDSPDPVFPDGDISYTTTVGNNGPDTAPNVVLNVPLNNTLRFQSMTVPAGWNCTLPVVGAGTSFSCTIASLTSGASSVFTLVLRANDEQFGINDQTIVQNFGANSGVADPNNANNSVNVSTQYVTPDADLQLSATDSPDPVQPDGDITYTITLANAGPDAASSAVLNVPLNNTLRFQSMVIPAGWSCTLPVVGAGTSFSCSNASLANGASAVFTLVLRANDEQFGFTDQAIVQTFSAGSAFADPNNANNVVNVTTQYDAPTADLAVTATGAPPSIAPGGSITYTVTLQNTGPDTAPSATLGAALDSRLRFQSLAAPAGFSCTTPAVGATGAVTCSIASLAPSPAASFTLVVQVDPALTGSGSIVQGFQASGAGFTDPDASDDAAQVTTAFAVPSANLSLSKTSSAASVQRGGTLTFTLVLSNAGPDAAANVVLSDVLPATLNFTSLSVPAGFTCTTPAVGATGTITCSAATLANAATATFSLVTTVATDATGTISNSATVASDTADPIPGDTSATAAGVPVFVDADLAISKTTAATSAVAGGALVYTLVISNTGPSAAADVTLSDALPASLRFASLVAPAGWTCTTPAIGATGSVSCSAASLPNGASATFTLTVTIAPAATGTISNTASVTSASNDPDAADNSATTPPLPVVAAADLRIAKTLTSPGTVAQGAVVDYTVAVVNDGPSQATAVVVTDVLPAGLAFVSATPSQGSCSGTTTISCTLGTLPAGTNATILMRASVTVAGGTIVNSASVAGAETDGDQTDNLATAAPLLVQGAVSPAVTVPAASNWTLLGLVLLTLLLAARRSR